MSEENNNIKRTVSFSAELDTQFVMEDFVNVSQMASLQQRNDNTIYKTISCPHCDGKINL